MNFVRLIRIFAQDALAFTTIWRNDGYSASRDGDKHHAWHVHRAAWPDRHDRLCPYHHRLRRRFRDGAGLDSHDQWRNRQVQDEGWSLPGRPILPRGFPIRRKAQDQRTARLRDRSCRRADPGPTARTSFALDPRKEFG